MNRTEKRKDQLRQPQYGPFVIRKMNGTDFSNMVQHYKKHKAHLEIAFVEKMRWKRERKLEEDRYYFK